MRKVVAAFGLLALAGAAFAAGRVSKTEIGEWSHPQGTISVDVERGPGVEPAIVIFVADPHVINTVHIKTYPTHVERLRALLAEAIAEAKK